MFRALCVLDEAVDAARIELVPPSPGLRLALAFLYVVGDRRQEWFDRQPYDDFWRQATTVDATLTEGHNTAGYGRVIHMRASMNAIARAAGMPIDLKASQAINRARERRTADEA